MSRHLAFSLRSAALLLIFATIFACGAREDLFGPGLPGSGGSGGSGGSSTGGSTPASATSVDLLLAIDNSRSMADKQEILSYAVPTLIQSLINPRCVDEDGIPASNQPTGPSSDCPSGFSRQFPPVRDLHVGVVTTSLGDHGGDVCPEQTEGSNNNDQGRLVSRNATGGSVPTYQSLGFLAWDPDQELSPPGLDDDQRLMGDLTQIVLGAGQVGCGFEALLESWYRFLVDPNPYTSIEEDGGVAVMEGTDEVVLMQREDFLRPNSLLAVILLSDENDCSMRDGSQYFYVAKASAGTGTYHLPRAQITCTSDPSDECCRSCGQSDDGCPTKGDECASVHDAMSDHINLRCFDQKRRFGIDFLYPIERYVDALSSPQIADREGNLEANPIFSDLNPSDDITEVRDARLVFLASIQGVPWQDIARRSSGGEPDLETGLNADGDPVGGFQSAAELSVNGVWDVILGDPSHYYADASDRPEDPLMRESVEPRSGANPITGDSLAPPGAAYLANPINGHEYSIDQRNDLQYTCIFALDQPRDCNNPDTAACDCLDGGNDNPLCQDSSNVFGTIQYSAKAYPGLRQAQLVKELDEQAVLGSICPAQTNSPNSLDFGYVPTIRTLVETIGPRLNQP